MTAITSSIGQNAHDAMNGSVSMLQHPRKAHRHHPLQHSFHVLISQIAADQCFPLHFTHAVFVLSSNDNSLDGLASLH